MDQLDVPSSGVSRKHRFTPGGGSYDDPAFLGDTEDISVCPAFGIFSSSKKIRVGGFIVFFKSLPGEMIQFDEHIFQMG